MIKKVLIIRFRRIGDAVLSTVLCSTIRKNFPEGGGALSSCMIR